MKFSSARYINNGIEQIKKADDISPQEYRTIYFKKIYCPNPECSAMLSHYQITKNMHRFFRTFKGFEHIDNCSYDKLYTGKYPVVKKGEQIKINIPDDDIIARLKRAYEKYVNPKGNKPKEKNPELQSNTQVKEIANKGIPASYDEGIEIGDEKLQPIYSRMVNEVSDDDKDELRCIIGKVYSMRIEGTHTYINLSPKKEDSVSVLFNPSFKDKYTTLYNNLPNISNYIKSMKTAKHEILCCCIGWVRVVSNKDINHKYNIELLKDVAITLNSKGLRELLLQNK